MWSFIIKQNYLIVFKYYILGLLSALIVFKFVTQSFLNHNIAFYSFLQPETMGFIAGGVIGCCIGGLVAFIIFAFNKNRKQRELAFWRSINGKKMKMIIPKYMLAFSIGGFFWKVTFNIFEMNNYNNFFQSLFSRENLINYSGVVLAFSLFGILFMIGVIKRIKMLYAIEK